MIQTEIAPIVRKLLSGTGVSASHVPAFLDKLDALISNLNSLLDCARYDDPWLDNITALENKYTWFGGGFISVSDGNLVYAADTLSWAGFSTASPLRIDRGFRMRQKVVNDAVNPDVDLAWGFIEGLGNESAQFIFDPTYYGDSNIRLEMWHGGSNVISYDTGVAWDFVDGHDFEIRISTDGVVTAILDGEELEYWEDEAERVISTTESYYTGMGAFTYIGTLNFIFGPLSMIEGLNPVL